MPVVVRLVDINDNVPKFVGAPYSVTVPEVGIVSFAALDGPFVGNCFCGECPSLCSYGGYCFWYLLLFILLLR